MKNINCLAQKLGELAKEAGYRRPLQVLQSQAGYYIGTADDEIGPISRESAEYFNDSRSAHIALETGKWTQKMYS